MAQRSQPPPSIIDAVQPIDADSNQQPQVPAERDRHQSSFVSQSSLSIHDRDLYQIQASHFLSNHFENLAVTTKNLEKLLTHRDWLKKQLRVTQAMIAKMSTSMVAGSDEAGVTFDGDMFKEAKQLMQTEQNKF